MIAVLQRVSKAKVKIESETYSEIERGLLVLLGVERGDTEKDVNYLVKKIIELRIFNDQNGKMNRSLMDIGGSMLVVSQFTLPADIRKGRRPSFNRSADPETGEMLYQAFITAARACQVDVKTGVFGAMMEIELINDGPVTIIADSKEAVRNTQD
ncbi:MAG: D-aminoacyl-tRNA deacylase [bacterium]